RVRLEHPRDPPRRDLRGPAGAHRRRPPRDGGHRRRDDRARRAPPRRGRRAGVPRRARLPQGSRTAAGPPRDERHQVLTEDPSEADTVSEASTPDPPDPPQGAGATPAAETGAAADAEPRSMNYARRRFFRAF